MNHYRSLNKELSEQVQTLRGNMKLYCDEILYLKEELMQKHQSEVNLRKKCYIWAMENFLQIVQTVHPDADILPIIKEHVQTQERISSCSTNTDESKCRRSRNLGESSSRSCRRSSLLATELQKSNSIINIRKSICSTSPIRRSRNEGEECVEDADEMGNQDAQNIHQQAEEEMTGETIVPQTKTQKNIKCNNVIYEESDEEGQEQNYDQDFVSEYESAEEVTDTSHGRTLKDVTNSLSATIECSQKENYLHETVRKGNTGRLKKYRKANSTDKKNSNDEYSTSMELDSETEKELPTDRRQYQRRLTDRTVISMEVETTLQESRRHSKTSNDSLMSTSIPITQSCNETCGGVDLNSSISVYTDMSHAPSSTPNFRQNSLHKLTIPCINSSNTAPDFESATTDRSNSRPSRKCKPKDLTEPKLGTKLRNENATKTKSKSK